MDHQMDQMEGMLGGGGTYSGHILPGLGLAVLALVWVVQDLRRTSGVDRNDPIQRGLLVPWFKIVLTSIGIWLEIPGRGWYPMDIVMGWQHATIHAAILLSGITDLLYRAGHLQARATFTAFGGAMLVGAAIFAGHGNHDGMSSVAHGLLALSFAVTGVLTLAEAAAGPALRRLRQAALLATGSWLAVIGWIIFGSGWDPTAMTSAGWVWLAFCWNAMVVGVFFGIVAAVRGDPEST